MSNIEIKISAEVSDLKAQFAIAKAESQALSMPRFPAVC